MLYMRRIDIAYDMAARKEHSGRRMIGPSHQPAASFQNYSLPRHLLGTSPGMLSCFGRALISDIEGDLEFSSLRNSNVNIACRSATVDSA